MSLITSWAGIDPLISAARSKNWPVVIQELRGIIKKYAGDAGLVSFDAFLDALKGKPTP